MREARALPSPAHVEESFNPPARFGAEPEPELLVIVFSPCSSLKKVLCLYGSARLNTSASHSIYSETHSAQSRT
jgi:hypothetical protein